MTTLKVFAINEDGDEMDDGEVDLHGVVATCFILHGEQLHPLGGLIEPDPFSNEQEDDNGEEESFPRPWQFLAAATHTTPRSTFPSCESCTDATSGRLPQHCPMRGIYERAPGGGKQVIKEKIICCTGKCF